MSTEMSQFIKTVLAQTDIVDIIQEHVSLKKTGSNHTGLCPFHHEKSPSFNVNANKQFYYCFGCHANGDAINFLIRHNNLTFMEALEKLASRLGLSLPETNQKQPAIDKFIYQIMRDMTLKCRSDLNDNSDVQEYLKKRGISIETQRRFHVGYCGHQYLSWFQQFSNQHTNLFLSYGLASRKNHGSLRPKFFNRLMFPIQESGGKVIGFGGRTLTDSVPKYLNSPETDLFKKRYVLYGLHQFRSLKCDHVFVVEGYMDVISLHSQGITNAVACLGTAFTVHHWHLIKKFVRRVTFCFDGDRAGKDAAWKSLLAIFPAIDPVFKVSFLFLPDQQDPDSFVQQSGRQAFLSLADQAQSWVAFYLETLKKEHSLATVDGRAAFLQQSKTHTDMIQNEYLKSTLDHEVRRLAELPVDADQTVVVKRAQHAHEPIRRSAQRIIALLGAKDSNDYETYACLDAVVHEPLLNVINDWIKSLNADPSLTGAQLLSNYQGDPRFVACVQIIEASPAVYSYQRLKFELLGLKCELLEYLICEKMGHHKGPLEHDDRSFLKSMIMNKKQIQAERLEIQSRFYDE